MEVTQEKECPFVIKEWDYRVPNGPRHTYRLIAVFKRVGDKIAYRLEKLEYDLMKEPKWVSVDFEESDLVQMVINALLGTLPKVR